MPAIFSGYSMNDHGFFYQGTNPFTNDAAVERMGHEQRRLKFPPPVENDGKYMRTEDQYKGNIREGWWSVCNASEDMCLTVACFSDLTESVDFNLNKKDGHGYLSPQSFFAVDPAKTISWTIYLFPDKYDGVVAGKTVREWVYQLTPADFKARAGKYLGPSDLSGPQPDLHPSRRAVCPGKIGNRHQLDRRPHGRLPSGGGGAVK